MQEEQASTHAIARYDGKCPSCESSIEVGDDIYLVDGEWVCEFC